MADHIYAVTIRQTTDTYIQLCASSPERALQLATNLAAGKQIAHTVTGTKTTTSPLQNHIVRVDR
jgi:hypothetical protein